MNWNFDFNTLLVGAVAGISIAMLIIWHKGGSQLDMRRCDEILQAAHKEKQLGNFVNAESLLERALQLFDTEPVTRDFTKHTSCIINLADCYSRQGKHDQARQMYEKLQQFWRSNIERGADSTLTDIDYFIAAADFGPATAPIADLYKTIVDMKRQRFGANHTEVVTSMMLYSKLLSRLGEKAQADQVEAEAKALQQGGSEKPS